MFCPGRIFELGQWIIGVVPVAWDREETLQTLLCTHWFWDFALQKRKLSNSTVSRGFYNCNVPYLEMKFCSEWGNEQQQEALKKTGHGKEKQEVWNEDDDKCSSE